MTKRDHHDAASCEAGRATPSGQAASAGQLSESHWIALLRRRTPISEFSRMAASHLPSPSMRDDNVASARPVARQ